MLKLISWNLAHRPETWHELAKSDALIALVQEAGAPPSDLAKKLGVEDAPWDTAGAGTQRPWRTSVVQLSQAVAVTRIPARSIDEASPGELAVSRLGTIAAAEVSFPELDTPITVVSVYSAWERPLAALKSSWIYADAAAHRLASDLSVFIGSQRDHRILVAGDFNILHGYGEHGSPYWGARYQTFFDRMRALGLRFVGPQAPNGRPAEPHPDELPKESRDVPTFHTNNQEPQSATRQLDFVFASEGLADIVSTRALNAPEEWGPSDHCRVEITVGGSRI